MQFITLLQNNSIGSLSLPPADKDSHQSDATSDSSFDHHPDDSPLFFKKSLVSTHFTSCSLEQEDPEDPQEGCLNDEELPCQAFFVNGYCYQGSKCPHSHHAHPTQTCKRKRKIHNQILVNFPSLMVDCLTRRINSFLQ